MTLGHIAEATWWSYISTHAYIVQCSRRLGPER